MLYLLEFIAFLVKNYDIYVGSNYYIYDFEIITFMVIITLMAEKHYMCDGYYTYGCHYIYCLYNTRITKDKTKEEQ